MKLSDKIFDTLLKECTITTSRSGGAGGQHVNKVETKVSLYWNVNDSAVFTTSQKEIIKQNLQTFLTLDGIIQIHQQTERSQLRNKIRVISRFKALLEKALTQRKKRKPTGPTPESAEKRKKSKILRSNIKEMRRKPEI